MPHIQGLARDEVLRFPPALDDYITENNPVRCIDVFVDSLDLEALGFTRVVASPLGRPAYHLAMQAKAVLGVEWKDTCARLRAGTTWTQTRKPCFSTSVHHRLANIW